MKLFLPGEKRQLKLYRADEKASWRNPGLFFMPFYIKAPDFMAQEGETNAENRSVISVSCAGWSGLTVGQSLETLMNWQLDHSTSGA